MNATFQQTSCGQMTLEPAADEPAERFDPDNVRTEACSVTPATVSSTSEVVSLEATIVNRHQSTAVDAMASWELVVSGILNPILANDGPQTIEAGGQATYSATTRLDRPLADQDGGIAVFADRPGEPFTVQARPVDVFEASAVLEARQPPAVMADGGSVDHCGCGCGHRARQTAAARLREVGR